MDRIEGIVCKVLDYKDSSKILYIYTEFGQRSIIARGVKKLSSLNRNLSQVGNIISFENSNRELATLKDGELVHDFEVIHFDLEAFTYGSHILELAYSIIDEHNDHKKMYHFIVRLMKLMNEGIDSEIISTIFELKMLHFLGYGLNFKGCNQCDSTDLVFSVSDGGLICKSHAMPRSAQFDEKIYEKIKAFYFIDIDKFYEVVLTHSERIMIRHILDLLYDEYVGYKSKSRSILKQIKKY